VRSVRFTQARDGKTPFNYAAQNCKAEALRLLNTTARRTRAANREATTKDGHPSSQRQRAFATGTPVDDHCASPIPATLPATSGGRSDRDSQPLSSGTQAAQRHGRTLTSTTASSLHAHAPQLGESAGLRAEQEGWGADGSGPTNVGLKTDRYLLNERLIREARQHAMPQNASPDQTVRGGMGDICLPSPAGLQASPNGSGQPPLRTGLSLSPPNRVTWRDEIDAKDGEKSGPSLVETALL